MKRAKSPDNVTVNPLHEDARARIAAEHQAEDPEFVYGWESDDVSRRELTRRKCEVVEEKLDDGTMAPVTLSKSMLVKWPKAVIQRMSEVGREISYNRVKKTWGRPDNADMKGRKVKLERHASPKRPPEESDEDESMARE